MKGNTGNGGTGQRFGDITVILAGVAALAATLLTFVSVWLQTKNYRKPLLQRYVIRILCMVPIYSVASWTSLVSIQASYWIDPFRDVYEAFTIYAFFQLLINFIGGERALIIMMHGRAPVPHLWPLNHFLAKIDISDPHTFLAIKRGILQYAWIKPLLAIATIIMKATHTYQEGYIGLGSGYFWSGLIYNVSITISLYALAMFWICMSTDLQPFRPMPKFLCIKGIIFASYWQGFFLSILVKLGAIPGDVPGYSPHNLAAAIQDALICFEMPIFAILHWYAFSWHDYADVTISAARMPVKFAMRDAFGAKDLIEDAKETFAGSQYEYRYFDAEDDVLAHEESGQRVARMKQGMRYERGGKGKYWIPQPGKVDSKTPLLQGHGEEDSRSISPSNRNGSVEPGYGSTGDTLAGFDIEEDDEQLFTKARALEFGDWNYPVITAHHASREDRLYREPSIITASTNRNILQPTKSNRKRRKSQIKDIQRSVDKGKGRNDSNSDESSTAASRVDLIVEDTDAEAVERVRARKVGNPQWNVSDPKRFVRTYPGSGASEEIKTDCQSDDMKNTVDEGIQEQWQHKDYSNESSIHGDGTTQNDAEGYEEQNVWKSDNG